LEGRGNWQWPKEGEIVIANYSIMPDYLKHDLRKLKAEKKDVEAMAVESALAEIPTGITLIVDEAHNVKSNKADRSRATHTLAKRAVRVWALTGTPLLNRAMDLWGVLNNLSLAGDVFGGWNTFTRLYGGRKNRWGGWEFGMPGPEVPERLRRVMLRRLRKDVLPDLPDKTIKTITVNGLNRNLQNDLDEAWEEFEDDVKDGKLPPFEKFSELRARLAESRIPALDELVEDYEEQDIPLVVFSAHRAPIDHLAMRKGWHTITGDTPPHQRQSTVTTFQEGRLKGVALTIAAGGVGLTLTHASHVVFVDLDWTPALNQQAEDRVARIGQTANKIQITRMQSNHVLDIHVTALIAEKISLIDASIEAEAVPVIPKASDIKLDQTSHVSKEENADLLAALKILSGVCDGAHAKDHVGFNGGDSQFGKSLATRTYLTDRQAEAARRMLQKYRRQLPEDLYKRLYPEAKTEKKKS
jgi:SNF2 family DNA or RNA helicase